MNSISSLLDVGHIRPSRYRFRSNVILVKKKDGGHRMVANFKKLNDQTAMQHWPLPRIDDILETLSNSQFFTKIDLRSGFRQIA